MFKNWEKINNEYENKFYYFFYIQFEFSVTYMFFKIPINKINAIIF